MKIPSGQFPPALLEELKRRDPADPLKVLLVHGSHTGGHRSAAASLAAALNELPNVQAEALDTLEVSSPALAGAQKTLFTLAADKTPKLRRWAFQVALSGSPVANWVGNAVLTMKTLCSGEVLDEIRRREPDLVVSTHSQTNAMLSHWRGTGELDVPVHSVATDFYAHGIWAQDHIDRYYVAAEGTREDLQRFGVDPRNISVTGIPISPSYAHPSEETLETRKARLGLDPKLPTIVLTGGSLGLQPYEKLVAALQESPFPMQIVAITGRNEEARKALEALPPGQHPVHVQGFVTNAREWLGAADVVVSKPGGLTISELLALRKPILVVNPRPGMEQAQVDRLPGVAWSAADPAEMRDQIELLLSDPAAKRDLERRMDAISRPAASYGVAAQVAEAALRA